MTNFSKEIADYIANVDEKKRGDTLTIMAMMQKHTGEDPYITSSNMLGFGRIKYRYPTGQSGETFIVGFAPRKAKFSLHTLWYQAEDDHLLAKLGKFKRSVGCLYINKLADIDLDILDKIIHRAATDLSKRYVVED